MKNSLFKFKGLNPYKFSDSDYFIGRNKSIESALEIFKKTKILIINGPEGNGKTSFINAGLLKRIRSGFPGKSGRNWSVCSTRPGISPIANLSRSLSTNNELYINSKPNASDFEDYIKVINKKKGYGLIEVYKESEIFEKKNLLIIIDQVEDLFKYSKIFNSELSSEDDLLIDLIYKSVKNQSCSIYFILSIQAFYFSKLNIYGKFSELLSISQFNLPNINLKNFFSEIKNKINFQISESVFEKIKLQVTEKPSYLTNFQFLLKKFNDSEFSKDMILSDEIFKKNGGIKNIINFGFDEYFKKQDNKTKLAIEFVFRSLIHSEYENERNFYQRFKYTREYCNFLSEDLTRLLLKINGEFGEIFDIISENISEIKSKLNYKIHDDDIIILKYSKSLNWNKFKSLQKEENSLYSSFEKLQSIINENKEIESKDLENGINLMSKQNINNQWSKKYDFNFQSIKQYLISQKQEKEKKLDILNAQIESAKKRKKTLIYVGVLVGFLLVIILGFGSYDYYEMSQEERELKEKEKMIMELEQDKDSLKKYSDGLLIKIEKDLDSLDSTRQIIKSREDSIVEKNKKIVSSQLKISEQRQEILKTINLIENANDKLDINQKFIKLTKKEIKLINDIKNLTKETKRLRNNEREKILISAKRSLSLYDSYYKLQKSKDSLIKNHVNDLKSLKELTLVTERNDINNLRKLANNVISKINGVNNITEVKDFNLLNELNNGKNNQLNKILITPENRVFSAGKSKKIYYSNEIEKGLENLTFSEYGLHSEITSIEYINSDVLFVGLLNGEIWYLSIDEKIKTKIFPKRKNKNSLPISSLLYLNQKIYSLLENLLIEYDLNTRVLTEVIIGERNKERLVEFTFDEKNNLYILTYEGNIIEYDINKRTHRQIFRSKNDILSYNDKVTKVDFFENKFIFSTLNGWIYIFDQDNRELKFKQRILAHNSEIVSLYYDKELNKLFSSSSQGTFCIIDINFDQNTPQSRIDIDFGVNSIITDVKSLNIEDKKFIIMSNSQGNLSLLNLELNEVYNYIRKFINN